MSDGIIERKAEHYYTEEKRALAPYAAKAEDSIDKRLFETTPDLEAEVARQSYRTPFMRDRDRIIHSEAFRRLTNKTQIYHTHNLPEKYRTRLSHTMEVLQISKSLGLFLGLNVDLIEAIALGHDLGHTPFGHIGEETLHGILSGNDLLDGKVLKFDLGFRHNYQSVRVVDVLEDEYEYYPGLNLTYAVREGIFKHTEPKKIPEYRYYCNISENYNDLFKAMEINSSSLEGQVVAIADEIAQVTHDIEDAINQKIMDCTELMEKNPEIVKILDFEDNSKYLQPNIISRNLLRRFITGIQKNSLETLKKDYKPEMYNNFPYIIKLSPDHINAFKELKKYYVNTLIKSEKINKMDGKAKFIIRKLYKAYLSNPRQLPYKVLARYFNNEKRFLGQDESKFEATYLDLTSKYNNSTRVNENVRNHYLGILSDEYQKGFVEFKKMVANWPNSQKRDYKSLMEKEYYLKENSKKLIENRMYIITNATFNRYVADHIALMSDVQASDEFHELYGHQFF